MAIISFSGDEYLVAAAPPRWIDEELAEVYHDDRIRLKKLFGGVELV